MMENFEVSDPTLNSTALTLRGHDTKDDIELQRLWLAARRRDWRSLAVIAASPTADTLPIAELLASLAWSYRGQPSSVMDLRDLSLRLAEYHQRQVEALLARGSIVVIALRSIHENPTAAAVARAADATLLCVDIGHSLLRVAEQTIAEVGRERVLGAVVVRRPRAQAPGRP
ncbi:MAG: hypothetical protein ACRENE_14925 [Polyangiaceae bacterium]